MRVQAAVCNYDQTAMQFENWTSASHVLAHKSDWRAFVASAMLVISLYSLVSSGNNFTVYVIPRDMISQ